MGAHFEFNNIRIAALACAVPSYVQKIDVEKAADPNYARLFQRQTGIRQRHISLTEQSGTDLAHGAAVKALEKAGWEAESLDVLVFLSQMPDFNIGTGNAFIMHGRLGLPQNVLAYDITLGCSSFPFGLTTCASLLQQKNINRCMMLSCDTQWHMYKNKEELLSDQNFLHGEGATAILLEKKGYDETVVDLYTDGKGYQYLFNPFSNVRNAWRLDKKVTLSDGLEYSYYGKYNYMDGLEITMFSTTTVADDIKRFMRMRHKDIEDYDGLVLHQANLQIIKTIARRLKFPVDRVPISLERYANTSGASLSLTLADAYAGYAKDKLRLLICAFGIGLSWGIAEVALEPSIIEPIFTYSGRCDDMLAH